MNWVFEHKAELEQKHYVLKNGVGWVGLAKSKVDFYLSSCGTDFNLILYGDEVNETNYYIIPYSFIKDLMITENLSADKKTSRTRWLVRVKNQKLTIGNTSIWLNITPFYAMPLTESAAVPLPDELIDYSSMNVKREISVRVDQPLFRSAVLGNFGYTCCLTGATEEKLLEASHIIPWSEDENKRLDPGNGLCLTVTYHKLFDQGYLTFDEQYNVVVTERIDKLSEETRRQLQAIRGKRIRIPKNHQLRPDALAHHRNKIFNRFDV